MRKLKELEIELKNTKKALLEASSLVCCSSCPHEKDCQAEGKLFSDDDCVEKFLSAAAAATAPRTVTITRDEYEKLRQRAEQKKQDTAGLLFGVMLSPDYAPFFCKNILQEVAAQTGCEGALKKV